MHVAIRETIAAAITLNQDTVAGNIPVFFARDEKDQARIAKVLSNVLQGTAHDLENGTLIIVKH